MTQRAVLALDGDWEFQIDPSASLTPQTLAPDRTIAVPGCWQAQFPDLLRYAGVAWYRRTLPVPADWANARARLTFDAVDYACRVWVNGALVGEHEGGYLPFSFEVGALLRPGETNSIVVRVLDVAHTQVVSGRWGDDIPPGAVEGFHPDEIPHGKQSWYCNVGGLWQGVRLERVPATSIERVVTLPDLDDERLLVRLTMAGVADAAEVRLIATPADGDGAMFEATASVAAGTADLTVALPMPGARRWSPERPARYRVRVVLLTAGAEGDERTVTTGLRSIAIRDGHLLLNGAPLYLRSALDQDFYPESVYTSPADEVLREHLRRAKALGLNSLRVHIKPPDPRYLDLADEIGLLIWEEVPSWRTLWPKDRQERLGDLPEATRARVRATLRGLIERDINHPSVIAYSIVNEDWGTQLVTSAADRAWLADLYAEAKALDPTRLICDNSPCNSARGPNVHVRTDIDDFHIYVGMPDGLRRFEAFVATFAQRPAWTFSAHGDAVRTGHEPLVLSEFGNWGLPEPSALAQHWAAGTPPWWWASHGWWAGANEASHPAGVEERFARWGLDAIWPDVDAFARATQWHQFAALRAQLWALRRRPAIRGWVITEFTDCYWEANGLFDFYRQPKVFHDRFAEIGGPTVVLPAAADPEPAVWSDAPLVLPLLIAHDGPDDLHGALVEWQVTDTAVTRLATTIAVPAGTVGPAGIVTLTTPPIATATRLPLDVVVRAPDGAERARTTFDLTVVPTVLRQASRAMSLYAWTPDEETVELDRAGYRLTPDLSQAEVALATVVTDDVLAWVRAGGRLLYLPAAGAVSPFLPVVGRSAPWDGNWISAFTFIRPGSWLQGLPIDNPFGFAYHGVMPRSVVVGLPDAATDDLLAGMVVGWCARLAGAIVQMRAGQGRVVICTFDLLTGFGHDPIATVMLHDLIAYLQSERCAPTLALP